MIGSWETEFLEKPEEFTELSMAYLDAGMALCSGMIDGSFAATYNKSKVILFLTHHAIELFLKGAVLNKSPNGNLNCHRLSDLHKKYEGLYKEPRFRIVIPFKIEYLGFSSKEIEELRKTEPPLDQLYRYPTDTKGLRWDGVHSFVPAPFLEELHSIKTQFTRLEVEIFSHEFGGHST